MSALNMLFYVSTEYKLFSVSMKYKLLYVNIVYKIYVSVEYKLL